MRIDLTGVPAPARQLVKQLAPGWHADISHARGPIERTRLSDDTDGDGKRHRVTEEVQVDSVVLKARHRDGRGLVALWIQQPGTTDTGKARGFAFDMAWRGRHAGEHVPHPLKASEAKAYAAADTPEGALAAVEVVRDEQAARTESRRSTRRTAVEQPTLDEAAALFAIPAPRPAVEDTPAGEEVAA